MIPKMASKILESGAIIPVFDRDISIGPAQRDFLDAQRIETLKKPGGAKATSTHFVRNALRFFVDPNFGKPFNEFLIAQILPPEFSAEHSPGSILPFGVTDHCNTGLRE